MRTGWLLCEAERAEQEANMAERRIWAAWYDATLNDG